LKDAGIEPEKDPEPVVEVVDLKATSKKKKKEEEIDPAVIEAARVKKAYELELATYGRTWIWEGFYEDTPDNKNTFIAGAEAIRHIHEQVMEDIEDSILCQGFPNGFRKKEQITKIQEH